MQPRSLKFVVTASGGTLRSGPPELEVRGVCTDSRKVQAGDLFFALRGDHFDGHAFLAEAARKGAAAAVIEAGLAPEQLGDCALILVEDTRQALGRLAGEYRKDFHLPGIAVCGSNGKTTTKELVAAVLRQKLDTLWSEASYNNDIGVPLTLLRLGAQHQAAVFEVGTNHPGELAPLLEMVSPTHGILTNVGREHLQFFGDLAGVAQEEGWLGEVLPKEGRLLVDGDSEWTPRIVARSRAPVTRVGFSDRNDWRLRNLRSERQGVSFEVSAADHQYSGEYRIQLLGRHQALNAVFALAIGAELGLARASIARGLLECKPAKMRMESWETGGVRILDDAYNANADSMVAALQTLQELPCAGRRIAVLGDMAELGSHSEAAHQAVGRRAAELGIGQLFAVGRMASDLARGARSGGLNRVFEFADVESAGLALRSFIKEGDLVLLKASRATRLERIGQLLRSRASAGSRLASDSLSS